MSNVPRTESAPKWGLRRLTLLGAAAVALSMTACGPEAPKTSGAAPDMRRLTQEQYRNSIADIFGPDIKIGGRLDSLVRSDGLLAIGARSAAITPSGLEKIDQLARSIAEQVTDSAHRDMLVACETPPAAGFDEPCAKQFFARVGRLLYRRPLTDQELEGRIAAARDATATLNDFYRGIESALAGMLVSPSFLFIIDTTEPDPANPGGLRLDSYAKAARLSYFLWNTTPDELLLDAAANGALLTGDGLKQHVDRMLTSPRLAAGVRGYFDDALALDNFDTLEKDSLIYPVFSLAVAEDAREQTLRTIEDVLVHRNEDYRNLFTTRHTFMSAPLARVYRVPMAKTGEWASFEFGPDDPRVGIQSHISFTALHAHPGRSSPTLRGKALRELLLCQKIPDPPADVDFTKFNDPQSPVKTARDRLALHTEAPTCAGCHRLTDPVGLGLEQFDGAGQYRTAEKDATIDASGDLDGRSFTDPASFGKALGENPAAVTCLVNRLYGYGVGRAPTGDEQALLFHFQERFASDGYKYPDLLRRIAASDAFYAVSPRAAKVAQLNHSAHEVMP